MTWPRNTALFTAIAIPATILLYNYLKDNHPKFSAHLTQLQMHPHGHVSSHAPAVTAKHDTVKMHHKQELLYDVGNMHYFSPMTHPAAIMPTPNIKINVSVDPAPAAVFRVPAGDGMLNTERLRSKIKSSLQEDDVISLAFLDTTFLLPIANSPTNTTKSPLDMKSIIMLSEEFGVKTLYLDPTFGLPTKVQLSKLGIKIHQLQRSVPSTPKADGPYLAVQDQSNSAVTLFPVYRLYPDLNRAFLYGLYPMEPCISSKKGQGYKAFRHVDALGYDLIPVPSRLYKTGAPNGVAGQRIAVKDIYDIKGVPTSAGCRAYGELYGPAKTTGPALQRLEEIGGHLIGKTKTAAFAVGNGGNVNTVDEQYPFSARGDGWQTARGSSSGSAVAMSAYEWLDFAIGTDTGGLLSLDNILTLDPWADTPGIFARDPTAFAQFLRAWYKESLIAQNTYATLPKRLIAPKEYLKQATPEAQALVDDFVEALHSKLGMQIEHIKLDDKMEQAGYSSEVIQSIFKTYIKSAAGSNWLLNGKPFYADYKEANQGRTPGIDPQIRGAWEMVDADFSWEQYEKYQAGVKQFGEWFKQEIMPSDDLTCSQSIMLVTLGTCGQLEYREDKLNEDMVLPNTSLDSGLFSPFTSGVDYTIPIGQVEALSKISGIKEQVPVTMNFVAHAGCDSMLMDFVDRLAESGLIKPVKTGHAAF